MKIKRSKNNFVQGAWYFLKAVNFDWNNEFLSSLHLTWNFSDACAPYQMSQKNQEKALFYITIQDNLPYDIPFIVSQSKYDIKATLVSFFESLFLEVEEWLLVIVLS